MHFENLKQILPEFNIYLVAFCIVFTYAAIIVTNNYFAAISDIYGTADYKVARLFGKSDKVIITFLWLLPMLMGIYLVMYPFGFRIFNGKAEIYDYTGSEKVKIPDRILFWEVTSIREGFQNNEKITEVVIPKTVTHIGDFAFANAINLEKVTYSESVEYIGSFAFANCRNLSDISMPGKKSRIGAGAFCNTKWLYCRKEDYVVLGNEHYIYIGDETEVVVPDGIRTVDFYLNKVIEEVTLPESIVDYIPYCFQGCNALSDMPLLNGVHWSAYCFGGCGNLTSIQGKKPTIHGDIRAFEAEQPLEIDEKFRIQCRKTAGVIYNVSKEEDASNPSATVKVFDDSDCILAYKEFVSTYKPEIESNVYKPRYGCAYIDDDELPELLIADDPNHLTGVKVFSYIDDTVTEIGIFGQYGSMRYAELKNKIADDVFYNGGAGGTTYYKYQKGVLEKQGSVFAHTQNIFKVNDEEVSEEVYIQKSKEYAGDYKYISFDYMDAFELSDKNGFMQ